MSVHSRLNWNLKVLGSEEAEGKTRVPGEKPLGARERTSNKLNPHIMALPPGFKPRPHWWEATAVITAPPLLPKLSDISLSQGTFCEMPISLSSFNFFYPFPFLFFLTLLYTCRIIEKNGGTPPLIYKKLCSIVSSMGTPSKPIPTIDKKTFDGCTTPLGDDEDGKYQVPTLEELGIEMPEESSSVLFPGGETEALRRLDEHMEKEVYVLQHF